MPSLADRVTELEKAVAGHLAKMGTGQRRLPGFQGEWEIRKIGEIAVLQRGFDLPNSSLKSGPYPVIYSNGAVAQHCKKQVFGPGVVTGRSGTIGSVFFTEKDFWPHNTTLWVKDFRENDPCDRESSGKENEHEVLKPFIAFQRVQLPPGKGQPTSRKRALHGGRRRPS